MPPPSLFFFNDTATTEIYTLSLHDALPISIGHLARHPGESLLGNLQEVVAPARLPGVEVNRHEERVVVQHLLRSEEHTSELQSRPHFVCRLLLEKKKNLYDATRESVSLAAS